MSVEAIKDHVLEFLSSPSPGTMSIRGAWGTGKTYAWKAWVKDAVSQKKLFNERCSYVSLFGIDSLQDLKIRLFEQTDQHGFWRKLFPSLSQLPYVIKFSGILHSVAFFFVNESLICIDDLERKGKNLSMSDVMGLVSYLKEEKECKVVLIHNDGALDGNDQREFDKYREKVIDFEYEYKPDLGECYLTIAFPENCDLHENLRHRCNQLEINNIRILLKIKELAKRLIPHVQDFEPEILDQSLHTLCLFAWCFSSSLDNVSPSYDYVKNIGLKLTGLGDNDTSKESDKRWNPLLLKYGHAPPDQLDIAIGHFIEKGYINKDEFNQVAKKKNEEVIAMKGYESFKDAWGIFHNSFENNEEEVVKQIVEALDRWINYVTPLNLQSTVKVLRGLKQDDRADAAIELYITQRSSETDLFDLRSYPSSGDITDETIINRFKEVFVPSIGSPSLREAVEHASRDSSWTPEALQTLENATVEDLYKLFKSMEGEDLSRHISAFVQFDRSGKAVSALEKIGKESAINALRVKKYGIHIDEDGL